MRVDPIPGLQANTEHVAAINDLSTPLDVPNAAATVATVQRNQSWKRDLNRPLARAYGSPGTAIDEVEYE